jgi:AraC family ethanolamine operon transcriptional activator
MDEMPQNFYINRDFYDFEELVENLRQWDFHISQLQRGKLTNSIKQLSIGNVQVGCGGFSGKTHQFGVPPPGKTIGFYADRDSQFVWRKKHVPQNGVMIFPSDSDFDVVTQRVHNRVYTITVADDMLASMYRERELDAFNNLVSTEDLICIPTNHIKKLQYLCRTYLQTIEGQPELIDSQVFQRTLEEELLCAVFEALFVPGSGAPRPTRKSLNRIWNKIEEIIETAVDPPIRVSELSRAAGVSDRTLLRLFQDRFGISPKPYLDRMRLNSVRRDLKKSSPDRAQVTDIANAWGFWHMGKFAADYKLLFGELPSTTLREC